MNFNPLDPVEFRIDSKKIRYIQTTSKLSSKVPLTLTKLHTRIRLFSSEEAKDLADIIQKRNVFSRHSWENSFYVSRVLDLSNKTVIEILHSENPDHGAVESQKIVEIIQNVALLSSSFASSRKEFQRLLGIEPYRNNEFNLAIGDNYRFIRSKSKTVPKIKGISVDEKFHRRFFRCGFHKLTYFCLSSSNLANRLISTINWLAKSREEPLLPAALIKTSIALESLLGFGGREPFAKSLAERAAFLLSSNAITRKQVSHIFKVFYNERSRTVHGSKITVSSQLTEGVDRLTIMLCLIIAANSNRWKMEADLREWCENMKWGKTEDLIFPFPTSYLNNALKLVNQL